MGRAYRSHSLSDRDRDRYCFSQGVCQSICNIYMRISMYRSTFGDSKLCVCIGMYVCMYICVCIRDRCGWSIKIDLWFLQRNSLPVAGEDVFLSITETSVGLVGNQ